MRMGKEREESRESKDRDSPKREGRGHQPHVSTVASVYHVVFTNHESETKSIFYSVR